MGILREKDNTVWTEEKIQEIIRNHFLSQSAIKYVAENLFIYTWESDCWIMTRSNITYEFEVKISKADFKNEFKHKTEKHSLLENKNPDLIKPNYYYFVVPENLIEESDIPEYAGLIYVTNEFYPYYKIIKNAPKLTDKKQNEEQLNLLEKFYYNYRDWKHKTIVEKKNIEELNRMIDNYNEKPQEEKKTYTKLLEENKKYKELVKIQEDKIKLLNKFQDNYLQELRENNKTIRGLYNILEENKIDIKPLLKNL